MPTKIFKLHDSDYNYLAEICANDKPIPQVINGKVLSPSQDERITRFFENVCVKYGFNPTTVKVNLPEHDSRFFEAEIVHIQDKAMISWCRLCSQFTGPELYQGCADDKNPACAWYQNPKTINNDNDKP